MPGLGSRLALTLKVNLTSNILCGTFVSLFCLAKGDNKITCRPTHFLFEKPNCPVLSLEKGKYAKPIPVIRHNGMCLQMPEPEVQLRAIRSR